MFFISWGTKVRVRSLGDRAEFCPGCLQPTRFTVKQTSTTSHIYGVPLGYSKGMTFGECNICGAHIEPMFDDAIVPVGTLSFQKLLAQTNPRLTPQHIESFLDVAGDPQSRLARSVRYFASKQEAVLATESRQMGGYTLFAGVAAAILALYAFHEAGPVGGSVAVIFGCVAVFLARRWEGRRRAARAIRPSLKRFLASHGITLGDLQSILQTGERPFLKLSGHLATGSYDECRMEAAGLQLPTDDFASLFFPVKQPSCA